MVSADTATQRAAALSYLRDLNDPSRAVSGLLGPVWFDEERGWPQAVRIGQFHRGRFESAPLQIVPVTIPDVAELASGEVFEVEHGRSARLQRVVYTGIFINEIPRIDIARSSFGADLYLWLRFARDGGPDSADPTDILFPYLMSGSFDRKSPSEQGEMPDGTVYRLWRVQGEFRNDFELQRFPFDVQTLQLPFFNARAAADRIVYVVDKRTPAGGRAAVVPAAEAAAASGITGVRVASAAQGSSTANIARISSPNAFRNLSQWDALETRERRENVVTDSALGDPRRVGAESYRELSGYLVAVDVQRRALATLFKNMLPLLMMTMVMYASLYFPVALVKEKITVVSPQLGRVGRV